MKPQPTLTELATIARLQEQNDALNASVKRLTDEMNMWWGVAIRRGDEIANLRRQLDSALSMNEMLKDQLREKQ